MTLPRHSASVLIPELLHEILSQLPLRDVAMAAITCQGWKESALDILWETVDLVDLLNVLAPTRKRAKELHFVRAVTRDDWSRFHNLAFRIRRGKLRTRLHYSLVAEVHLSSPDYSPLLPAITYLDLRTEVNGHEMLFLGPTLNTLRLMLVFQSSPHRDEEFFARVPLSSPSITDLTLIGINMTKHIANLSHSLPGLRFVDVSLVEGVKRPEVISALAGCRELEEMVVWGCHSDIQWSSGVGDPFRRLRRLTVIESSDHFFASFMDRLPPNLTHFQHGVDDFSYLSGDIAVAIAAVARHQQLESLVINPVHAGARSISPRVLQPLYSCSRLRVISITMTGSVDITDGDIAQLASHLPRLEVLELKGIATHTQSALPSLQALAIIVTSCATIQKISLMMDSSLAQLPPDGSFKASSSLKLVDVQTSCVKDIDNAALFFGRLCTAEDFELRHGHANDELGPGAHWNAVERLAQIVRKPDRL